MQNRIFDDRVPVYFHNGDHEESREIRPLIQTKRALSYAMTLGGALGTIAFVVMFFFTRELLPPNWFDLTVAMALGPLVTWTGTLVKK
jgi:hypothetical protein